MSRHTAPSAVNVFVTGQPGIGKTTMVLNVAGQLPKDLYAGFYTVDARPEGSTERVGRDIVTFDGQRCPLTRLRRGCGIKIGKYYVAMDEFERTVLPQLTPSEDIKLHIIDEIGRIELLSEKFQQAVTELLDSPCAVFGAIPAPRHGQNLALVDHIMQRSDTAILTLTRNNREATTEQVVQILRNLIGLGKDEASQKDVEGYLCKNEIETQLLQQKVVEEVEAALRQGVAAQVGVHIDHTRKDLTMDQQRENDLRAYTVMAQEGMVPLAEPSELEGVRARETSSLVGDLTGGDGFSYGDIISNSFQSTLYDPGSTLFEANNPDAEFPF